jgi:hypothetical protein
MEAALVRSALLKRKDRWSDRIFPMPNAISAIDRCSRRAKRRTGSRAFALRTESWGSTMPSILD